MEWRPQKSALFQDIISKAYQHALYYWHDLSLLVLTLTTWVRHCLSGFSTVKLTCFFSPLSTLSSWMQVKMQSPHLRGGQLWSILHRVSGSSPICLFVCLFISSQMCGYLFYTLDYNTTLQYFVVQIISDLYIRSSFSWLLCPWHTPHHCEVFTFSTSIFVAL